MCPDCNVFNNYVCVHFEVCSTNFHKVLFVFQPIALRVHLGLNPDCFFYVETLLVECARNSVKSMLACLRNNLSYLGYYIYHNWFMRVGI